MDIQDVLALLSRQGHRITQQRALIIRVVFSADSMLSAEGVLEKCREEDAGISLPTVYRNLDILVAAGVVRKQHFGQDRCWYERICPGEHIHHMVCKKCGSKMPIPCCPSELMRNEARLNRFKILDHQFEVVGLCEDCQEE